MLERNELTPTANDIGREVIYVPDNSRGTLKEVHGFTAKILIFGSKKMFATSVRNLQIAIIPRKKYIQKKPDREKTRPQNSTSIFDSTEE
jgi:hypothetical protein